jgi:hypothetical protein
MDNVDGNSIRCPYCNKDFPLTKAVSSLVGAQLKDQFEKLIADMKQAQDEDLKKARKEAERKTSERLEKEHNEEYQRLRAESMEKARKLFENEMAEKNEELLAAGSRLQAYQKKETALLKRERELEESRHSMEVEFQEKFNAELKKVYSRAEEKMEQEYKFKLLEKEKIINDLSRQMKEGQKKAEQGSMQLQGEVLELEIEDLLGKYFSDDDISPVETGKKGGDIIQTVKLPSGRTAGRIIWELKRTKNWNSLWITKLKEDQRNIHAELAVIASEALPAEIANFALVDGVWVTDIKYIVGLAAALRENLRSTALVKIANEGKADKAELVYDYLTGTQFKQRVESILEVYKEMKDDLDNEKRVLERSWAKREKQIERFVGNMSGMYGDLQGLGAALQSVKYLEAGEG